MKKTFVILLFILIANIGFSQTGEYRSFLLEQQYDELLKHRIGSKPYATYEDIEGNAYIYKDFEEGYIKTSDDKTLKGKFRYNMYTDEIEFLNKDKFFILADNEKIKGIKIGDYSIIKLHKNNKVSGYFFVNAIGKYTLLSKKSVRFVDEEDPKGYDTPKPKHFKRNSDNFYLLESGKDMYEIKNIRKLKSYSGEMRKMVKEYKAENKLKNDETSLTHFFEWLNKKY
ncbi:MAG TPA: hypothetical protein VJ896_03650 [Bacteroidales bacterium]|nr:hypothetical protein [Bacteroidales bacterium]